MSQSDSSAIAQQLEFLIELDRLKLIVRQSHLASGARRENSAEHSWHLAMFALALARHADNTVDVSRVIKLLLLHDIVEIDAGDAPIHVANGSKADLAIAEQKAAERIFGLLPAEQAAEFHSLWLEFEAGQSPEAQFAKALDRLQPLLLNVAVGGGTWTENGIGKMQVHERYGPAIAGGSTALWEAAKNLVDAHFAKDLTNR